MGSSHSVASNSISSCYGSINKTSCKSNKRSPKQENSNSECCSGYKRSSKCFFCCCCSSCCCNADSADYELELAKARRFPEPERYMIFSRLSNKQRLFDAILRSTEQTAAASSSISQMENEKDEKEVREENNLKDNKKEKITSDNIPIIGDNGTHETHRLFRRDKDIDTWSVWSSSVVQNPEVWYNERQREDEIINTVACSPMIKVSPPENTGNTKIIGFYKNWFKLMDIIRMYSTKNNSACKCQISKF